MIGGLATHPNFFLVDFFSFVEDHSQEVVVLDVFDVVCVYPFISVEIKTNIETVVVRWYTGTGSDDPGDTVPIFLIFGEGVITGHRPDFLNLQFLIKKIIICLSSFKGFHRDVCLTRTPIL